MRLEMGSTALRIAMAAASTFAPLGLRAQDAAAVKEGLSRQDAEWVRTTTGQAKCTPNGRLQIAATGRVILQGYDGDTIQYTLTQRTRANSEIEARRAMGSVIVNTRNRGEITTFVLTTTDRGAVRSEVRLSVPRTLREAQVETQKGGVETLDLNGLVKAIALSGPIRADRIGGGFTAQTGGGEIRIGQVGGPVRCLSAGGSIFVESARGEMFCQTAGGEINVREAGGPLEAITEGGNIQVWRASSSVSARSAAGLIEILEAQGLVTAETRGGSIQVGSARGVRLESGMGTIRLRNVTGPVHATTARGSILAELGHGTRLEDSLLASGSGDVTVLIPSNLAVSVQARNESAPVLARIVSEFPEIRIRTAERERMKPAVAEGALNGGGPVLRISAAGGSIFLRRQR
jgi:hypothetical protein